jgi:hypothetical protein
MGGEIVVEVSVIGEMRNIERRKRIGSFSV